MSTHHFPKFTPDDITALFSARHSARSYKKQNIDAATFTAILQAGRLSPSSVGSEPWCFLVLQNPAVRQKLAPVCWGIKGNSMDNASHIVAIIAKKNARYDSPFFKDVMQRRKLTDAQQQKALAAYQKFQAEDMQILDDTRLFDWTSKQTYIALGNMLTAAKLLGVDSCPIEGFDYKKVDAILTDLKLYDGDEWGTSVMATFGYADAEAPKKTRRAFDEVVQVV